MSRMATCTFIGPDGTELTSVIVDRSLLPGRSLVLADGEFYEVYQAGATRRSPRMTATPDQLAERARVLANLWSGGAPTALHARWCQGPEYQRWTRQQIVAMVSDRLDRGKPLCECLTGPAHAAVA